MNLTIKTLLFLIPIFLFSGDSWIFWGLDEAIDRFDCEQRSMEITFETEQLVTVTSTYPILSEKGALVDYVNERLEYDAENWFDRLVREEKNSKEIWDEDYGVSYALFPVYVKPTLISIFGCENQGRGAHGCSDYEGKTFWRNGDSILEVTLDDLFIKESGYRLFILQYCENALKTSGYGYYSYRKEFLPELSLNDFDVFVLTERGVMIVFSAYKVGGWGDGPDTLEIPYSDLKKFIDPQGPLKSVL